ncbi:MAG: hypothetical protein AAGA72_02755 [Pseudomonadota bacterium]
MTQAPERDSSGRFVKPDAPEPIPSDADIHPMSKLLFGWVSSPRTPTLVLALVILIAIILLGVDFTFNRHEYFDFANANGFYALWGFGAFALAVLSGWPLGKLLRRDEDYYGEADTTPKDVESDS